MAGRDRASTARAGHLLLLGALLLGALLPGGCSASPGANDNQSHAGHCGDHKRQPWETCDGLDLGGWTCELLGRSGGELACTSSCQLDLTGCSGCGDGNCAEDEDAVGCPRDCGVRAIGTGSAHSCALLGGGTAWCWGSNTWGQLGPGCPYSISYEPVQITGLY